MNKKITREKSEVKDKMKETEEIKEELSPKSTEGEGGENDNVEVDNQGTGASQNPAKEELLKKDKEIEVLKDQLLRNMAEYDNYRKRTSRERIELEPEITAKAVSEFLATADNLERALSAECSDENFKKGIRMIYDSFIETLKKLGVEPIPAEGAFDPSMHQAVQQVPAEEGQESGIIAATFQKGYKLGNRILRFAMVAVTD